MVFVTCCCHLVVVLGSDGRKWEPQSFGYWVVSSRLWVTGLRYGPMSLQFAFV